MVEKLLQLGDKATTVRCVSQLLTESLLDHPPPGDDRGYGNGNGGDGDGDGDGGGGSGEGTHQLTFLNAAVALVNGGSAHHEPGAVDEGEGLDALLLKVLEIPELCDNTEGHSLLISMAAEGPLSLALRRKALQLLCATRQGLDALDQRLCLGPGSQLVMQMMEDSHGPLKLAPVADPGLKRKLERHRPLSCHDVAVIALVQNGDNAEADLNAAKSSALVVAQECVEELNGARSMGMGSLALAYAGAVYRAKRMIKTVSDDMLAGATANDGEGGGESASDEGGDQELTNIFVPQAVKVLLKVDNSAVHYLLKLLYAVLGSDGFGGVLLTHAVWLRHMALNAAAARAPSAAGQGFGRKQANKLWDSFIAEERKAGDEAQIINSLPMAFTERDSAKNPPNRLEPLVRTFETARLAVPNTRVAHGQTNHAVDDTYKQEMEIFKKRVVMPLKAIGMKARADPEVISVLLHIAAGIRFNWDGIFGRAEQNKQVIEFCTGVFAKEIEEQQSQRAALAALLWVGQPGLDLILTEDADRVKKHTQAKPGPPKQTEKKIVKQYGAPMDNGATEDDAGQRAEGDNASKPKRGGDFTFVPRATPHCPRQVFVPRQLRMATRLPPRPGLSNKERWPLEGAVKTTNLGAQRLAVHLSMIAIAHPESWIARFISRPGIVNGEEGVPGMSDNVFASIFDALNSHGDAYEHLTWYKCANGHPYTIGNCGKPMEKSRCSAPGCFCTIGGQGHVSEKGNSLWSDVAKERGSLTKRASAMKCGYEVRPQ